MPRSTLSLPVRLPVGLRITLPVFLLAVLITAGTMSSCRKVYDFIKDHPDAHDSLCRITQLRLNGYSGRPDTFDVLYNAKGDPTDMLERNVTILSTDNIEQHFRYDKYERLLYYYINYSLPSGSPPATDGLIFHKYAYPRPNFVVDTIINYSPGHPPMYDSAFDARIVGYTLDQQGRIVKIWNVFRDPHTPPEFAGDVVYDANGNLPLSDGTLTYDNKVNLYRTSRIWQFVNQDYSRNNVVLASLTAYHPSYNAFGLPVAIPKIDPYYGGPFGFANTGPTTFVDYACSMPKGPINY